MKIFVILIIIIIVFISFFFLTRNNIEHYTNNDTEVIMYYADWCPYCKSVLPEFKRFMETSNLKASLCDCTNNKDERCKKVRGFPTIQLQSNGKVIEMGSKYTRTKDGIEQFCSENI